MNDHMNFPALVDAIQQVHTQCAVQANRAVNMSLTIRNWVIGWYIREYEQKRCGSGPVWRSFARKIVRAFDCSRFQGTHRTVPAIVQAICFCVPWNVAGADRQFELAPIP